MIAGGISPSFLRDFAQTHERAGFDYVLVGYYASSAEGFTVATYAAAHTEKLRYLIAHRPGVVSPTLAARAAATMDQLSGGRLALHIIVGNSDADQQRGRRLFAKGRALCARRRVSRRDAPGLDLDQAVRLRGHVLSVSGTSSPRHGLSSSRTRRCSLAVRHRAQWRWARSIAIPSPCSANRSRRRRAHREFRRMTQPFGRTPRFNVSFRPIVAETEGKAGTRRGRSSRT